MKKIIYVLLALVILCGCSGTSDKTSDKSGAGTETTTKKVAQFDDDSGVLMADGSGNFYLDGEPISSEEYDRLITEDIADTTPRETPADTEDPTPTDDPLKNDPSLGKYVDTGDTELNIVDFDIYNNSDPGVQGVTIFAPGDNMIVNLWCSDTAYFDSVIYIVAKDTPHKDSYEEGEYIHKQDMFMFSPVDAGQIFGDIVIPENITPGIYELRFIYGTEEGYIPYYIG